MSKKNVRLNWEKSICDSVRRRAEQRRRTRIALCLTVACFAMWNSDAAQAQRRNPVRPSSYSTYAEAPSPAPTATTQAPTTQTPTTQAPAPAAVSGEFSVLADYPESEVVNYAPIPAAVANETQTPIGAAAANAESLEDALRVAVEQSRTQRALALREGAAHSAAAAARSLKNPKINNTTTYVGMLNQPKMKTDIDLSGSVGSMMNSLPADVASAIAPVVSSFPLQYQFATPLVDKDFVTTVTSVTLPIYLGGRVEALAQEAEALTQAIAAGEQVDLQRVKLETTEAFFLVLRMRALHQVTLEAVEVSKAHLNDAMRMEKVGILTRNVVLAAQVAHSEAQQAELKVATALAMAESAYNRVLWRPLDAPVNIRDEAPGAPLEDVNALMNAAVANRGELRALSAEARAMQAQIRVAQADVKPQVAAVGAYSYVENSHMTANNNATAAIGVTWTPFDGGTSRARQEAARQSAMALSRMREEAESAVKLQVREAWLLQKEAYQRVEIAAMAVKQAEENLRVVTRGFQEGTLNHTEALDASTQYTAAKSAYANAKYDSILATERLKRAVGEP